MTFLLPGTKVPYLDIPFTTYEHESQKETFLRMKVLAFWHKN